MRRTCLIKPLSLLLPIALAAALMGLPSIGETQSQRPASVVDGAHRGYLAVRLLGGGQHEVIDELNADRLFVPASVLKGGHRRGGARIPRSGVPVAHPPDFKRSENWQCP